MTWTTTSRPIALGNAGTRTTLKTMGKLARAGAGDPLVIRTAQDIVRGVPERNDRATMAAMLMAVRKRMRFTPDPLDTELVKEPRYVLEQTDVAGRGPEPMDCDDVSVLLAALLGAVGIRSRFVVTPSDQRRRGEWSHVYVKAMASDGTWIPLDPVVRQWGIGREVPEHDVFGRRESFPGVEGYEMHTYGRQNHGMMGLGYGGPAAIASALTYNAQQKAAGVVTPATAAASPEPSIWEKIFGQTVSTGEKLAQTYLTAKYTQPAQVKNVTRINMPQAPGFFEKVDPTTGQIVANPVTIGMVAALGLGALYVFTRK